MSEDLKRDKLALMEELLAFMRRFEWTGKPWSEDVDDSYTDGCDSCGEFEKYKEVDPHNPDPAKRWAHVKIHKPDCKDTARRKELESQIAELKKELGI